MIPLRTSERVYTPSVIIISLIVANLLIFLYEVSMGPYALNVFIARHGLVPDRFHFGNIISAMFLHGGWLHVLGNMWFLWIYGRNVEDLLGSGKFLVFYLLCGTIAGLVHVFFNPYSPVPTVGASGAIAGVMGAYLIKFPRSTIVTLVPVLLFFMTLDIPAALLLVYWFAIQFLSGFGSMATSQVAQGGVAWFAHIGGFVAGMLLINVFRPKPRFPRWS
jgi:membrane associated rhomboid family serine protease